MTETPCTFIRLAWNPRGWTQAINHMGTEGGFPATHGWAGEDWNFALDQAVDGRIYGYSQATIGHDRLRKHGRLWDIVFYSREPGHAFHVVGIYRRAKLLAEDEASMIWRANRRGWVQARSAEVTQVVGAQAGAQVLESKAICWAVDVTNVTLFENPPLLNPADHGFGAIERFVNAIPSPHYPEGLAAALTRLGLPHPELLDAGFDGDEPADPEQRWEGRKRLITHTVRERDTELSRQARADNRAAHAGTLTCEVCGQSWHTPYGDTADRLFDVHHTRPMAVRDDQGEPTTLNELAVLCVLCHRASHATKVFDPTELRAHLNLP